VEVLNFATEHVMGPYRMANTDVEGVSVFTNNGVSGEFRGFGGNQAIFALEGQLDRLAEKTGIDPWVIRLINLRKKDDQGPFGQQIAQTDGAFQVWEALNGSDIWQNKLSPQTTQTTQGSLPWIRHGVGAAIVMHGAGLGVGIPDPAGGRLTLTREGKIEAAFGYEEFGQGLISSLEIMLKEHFNCTADDLDIVIGDTDRVPQSGSSTASRATSMLWMALQRLKPPFEAKLLEAASLLTAKPVDQLKTGPCGIWLKSANLEEPLITYKILAEKGTQELSCDTEFNYPTSPDSIVGGHFLYTYAAVAVRVEVNILTGRVKVLDQFHSIAAGPVINPQGFLGQIEGGSVMALGFAITEEAIMEAGHYMTRNLDTYLIPTISDIHAHFEVDAIEDLPEEDVFGPRGVGEIGTVGLAPAIASAIHQAVGMRVNKLPISPEQLQQSFILGREGAGFR
jgi:CO/xanthine dehydrogenase Mo-binding subunit